MNKVVLVGRLTKDPELRFAAGSGSAVCRFTVSGSIRTGSYDAQDGTKRYTTDVAVDSFDFIGGNSSAARSNDSFNNNNGNSGYSAPANDRFGGDSFNDDITPVDDGDMPF